MKRVLLASWLLASMVALAACGKRVEIDAQRLSTELDTRTNAVLNTPPVEKALAELFAAVSADPRVSKAGNGVMASLGEDARLQQGFAQIVGALGQEPAVQAMVREVMRAHPKAGSDEIGELMGKRMSGVFDGPVFNRAFEKAFDRFLKRPEVSPLLNGFGEKVARNPHMAQLVNGSLDEQSLERAWRDKVVALNGGGVPDRRRATDLVAGAMLTNDRVARWCVKIYTLPTTKREAAAGVARLLDAAAFRRLTTDLVVALVGDATFRQRAIDGMVALMAAAPTPASIEKAIDRLLAAPVVATALSAWLKGVMADPQLSAIGEDILKAIVKAPDIRSAIVELATPS